jgi:ribosomal protein L34
MTKFTLTDSRLKVIKVSGFRQRMKTRSGKRILKKRRNKKRKYLVPVHKKI